MKIAARAKRAFVRHEATSELQRDESRETDIASTINIPHLHFAHNASFHDAPHPPAPGAGTCGAAAGTAGTPGVPLGTTAAEAPGLAADRAGAWACVVREVPEFDELFVRCDGAEVEGRVFEEEEGLGVPALAVEGVEIEGCDELVGGLEGTPRSRSPMLGRSFRCSPQYSGKAS